MTKHKLNEKLKVYIKIAHYKDIAQHEEKSNLTSIYQLQV